MPSPSSQLPLFEQADQEFDLDRLRSDLEVTGPIDPRAWDYLKGVLCGLDQEEIAKRCSVAKGTVKTALTRGARSQILGLFPDKSEVDWKRLPAWLIEAGYGIGANHRINWQQVCQGMLDRQKKLSTNEVIASEAMQFDLLNDKIFVSLALVERKEPDRLSQDVSPASSERYEEKPPIEYATFREQVLREGKSERIAIIGEPGAGKTTLLQHIAFWILDQELGLPIWISIGDLIKNGDLQSLKDYLTQVWLEDAIPNVTQNIKSAFLEQLSKQRVWLLLDGADEIVASSSVALREIDNQLRGLLSQPCVLLTCRLNSWDADINAIRDFQTYRTKEFQYPNQVEQFIENGFCKSNLSSGQSLKTELAKPERTRLQQLVRSPLRLMMLCTTWHEHKGLPSTKAELYERFVNEFYKWNKTKWKKKDLNYALFPNTKAKQEKLNQALGRLACQALDKELSPFRLPYGLVFDELGDPDEDGSDFWLALNLGWLQVARNSDKPSEKVYIFFHPTFQEYFAALAIDDWDYFLPREHQDRPTKNCKGEVRYRIFEPQWKEPTLLWLGRGDLDNQPKKLTEKLINFDDGCDSFSDLGNIGKGFYSFQAYFLATFGVLELENELETEAIISQLIEWATGRIINKEESVVSFISPVSDKAFETLLKSESSVAIHILEKSIREVESTYLSTLDTNYSRLSRIFVKYSRLVRALGEFSKSQQEALKTIITLIENSKDDMLLCQLIQALGMLEKPESSAISTLTVLTKRQNHKIRREAAFSLGQIDETIEEAVQCLVDSIDNHESEEHISVNFLRMLAEQNNKYALEALEDLRFKYKNDSGLDIALNVLNSDSCNFDGIRNRNCNDSGEVNQAVNEVDEIILIISSVDASEYFYLIDSLKDCMLRLKQYGKGNLRAVDTLLKVISDPKLGNSYFAFLALENILESNQMGLVVSSLCKYLLSENHEKVFFDPCYQIIWHCAQNMSYSAFYRAWHNPSFSTDAELSTDD